MCENPPENGNELICQAPLVSAFEVNADGGDDRVMVSMSIHIPVKTPPAWQRQRHPDRRLGNDKLIGGPGNAS